jgi:hypothetical protein
MGISCDVRRGLIVPEVGMSSEDHKRVVAEFVERCQNQPATGNRAEVEFIGIFRFSDGN